MVNILNFEKDFSSKSDQAQDIVWEAWDAEDSAERIALAHRALKIDPDCSDAYNVLGCEESDPDKKREYFKKTIDVFKKHHNKKYFDETTGYFWGELETRPFMRGLQEYGICLWKDGKEQEAIETYREMLKLNPNDNQGIRFILINWFIIAGDFQDAHQLVSQHGEFMASMSFAALLLGIIEKENKKKIQKRYAQAVEKNPFIVPFLLKKKKLPKTMPEHYGMGSKEEAVIYMTDEYGNTAWEKYPDALKVLTELAKGNEG
jgi:tetratricopeptide (TPR) repeat protein